MLLTLTQVLKKVAAHENHEPEDMCIKSFIEILRRHNQS